MATKPTIQNIQFQFNQGYVSARDETELEGGELVSGIGAFYKPGDPDRVWKEPGRSLHFNFSGLAPAEPFGKGIVKGLALCMFETNTSGISISGGVGGNKIVAYIDDRLDFVNPESIIYASGTLVSGVIPSGYSSYDTKDRLFSANWDDIWYLSVMDDRPYVLSSDVASNLRRMGLHPPQLDLTGGVDGVGGLDYAGAATVSLLPTGSDAKNFWHFVSDSVSIETRLRRHLVDYVPAIMNTMINPGKAFDSDRNSFGYMTISPSDKSLAIIQYSGFVSESGTQTRTLEINYQIVGPGGSEPGAGDQGIGVSLGANPAILRCEVEFEVDDELFTSVQGTKSSGYYIPHPKLDKLDQTYYAGDINVVSGYTIDQSKGGRVGYFEYANARGREVMTLNVPAGYDISGMRVRFSLYPKEQALALAGWEFFSPLPWSNTSNTTAELRLYDIRVIDGTNSVLVPGTELSGVRYAVTEIDTHASIGGEWLESVPSPQSRSIWFSDRTGTIFTLPSGSRNPTTTHYGIYRSNLPGGEVSSGIDDTWNHFGRIKVVKTNPTSNVEVIDTFNEWSIIDTPDPLVATIAISADDQTTIYKLRNFPPPVLRYMTEFKGSIVGISNADRRSLVYSYAGYAEYFPQFHNFSTFPLRDNEKLVGVHSLNNALVVLSEGGVMVLDELPHARLGRLIASNVTAIEGAPGCVGEYAFTECLIDGFPALAYVSIHGIYVTDAHSSKRISDDLAWDIDVNRATLDRSVLFYDKDFKQLIFIFDKDSDDFNDTKLTFHLDPVHRKKSGMPKITGPTPAKLNDMIQGQIDDTYKIFSGSANTQKVFVERSGIVDASNSWSGGTNIVPFNVKTGRMYGEWDYLSALRGNLRHTDWGTGNAISGIWTAGRDDGDNQMTVTKSISLAGVKGDEFFIGRAGEYHQIELQHTTSGTKIGGIHHVKVKVQVHGSDSGDV